MHPSYVVGDYQIETTDLNVLGRAIVSGSFQAMFVAVGDTSIVIMRQPPPVFTTSTLIMFIFL